MIKESYRSKAFTSCLTALMLASLFIWAHAEETPQANTAKSAEQAGKVEAKAEAKAEAKTEAKAEAKAEAKSEQKAEAKAKPAAPAKPRVKFETTLGSFVVELNPENAPVTVKNFLSYVNAGFYNGLIFHRVIANFMIQGGGFSPDMKKKPTNDPIILESNKGLSNLRGSIAMARTSNPNSATSQFFINVVNNRNLDNYAGGYAVFGQVIEGMETVDKIRVVQTKPMAGHRDVPVTPVVIQSAKAL